MFSAYDHSPYVCLDNILTNAKTVKKLTNLLITFAKRYGKSLILNLFICAAMLEELQRCLSLNIPFSARIWFDSWI